MSAVTKLNKSFESHRLPVSLWKRTPLYIKRVALNSKRMFVDLTLKRCINSFSLKVKCYSHRTIILMCTGLQGGLEFQFKQHWASKMCSLIFVDLWWCQEPGRPVRPVEVPFADWKCVLVKWENPALTLQQQPPATASKQCEKIVATSKWNLSTYAQYDCNYISFSEIYQISDIYNFFL